MSNLQFGTLRYILRYDVHVEHVRLLHAATFGSLLQNGWIERSGTHIRLTKLGMDEYEKYNSAQASMRKYEAEITERVRLMLHISNLATMKRAS